MTPNPEDKIIAALDRNTEAIQRHTIQSRRDSVFYTAALSVISTCLFLMTCCPRVNAAQPLPQMKQTAFADIGQLPSSPSLPNPNLQYWYTADIPSPQGVLPQEVYAPRLVAQVASEPQTVETPEPGTWILVGTIIFLMAIGSYASRLLSKAAKTVLRYGLALANIERRGDAYSREVARKALEEK